MAAYRAALNLDPDNLPALNNLAVELGRRRHYAEAESLVVRASHLGRGASFFENAVIYQVAQGHFAAARFDAGALRGQDRPRARCCWPCAPR